MADRFPPEFLWGEATVAHQVEGANSNSDRWLRARPVPSGGVQVPALAPSRRDPPTLVSRDQLLAEIVDPCYDGLRQGEGGDWLGVQYYRKNRLDGPRRTVGDGIDVRGRLNPRSRLTATSPNLPKPSAYAFELVARTGNLGALCGGKLDRRRDGNRLGRSDRHAVPLPRRVRVEDI